MTQLDDFWRSHIAQVLARLSDDLAEPDSHYESTFLGEMALHPITKAEAMARFPKDYLPGDELFVDRHDEDPGGTE